jgi:hypothetical protein
MKSASMTRLVLPAAVLATLGLPAAATGQYRLPEITSVARADSLHMRAEALSRSKIRWRDAARLHRQSAALRPAEDSLGYRCLWVAAQLSYGSDDLSNARISMAEAGAQALARGDIVRAAHAFADAAWLAKEQNKAADVWKFGRQAEVLADSPLLSRTQRTAILKRFTQSQGDLAAKEP